MSRKWLKAALIRAVRTIAQTAAAMTATYTMCSEVDWLAVGSASILSGLLSMLTSIAGLPEVREDTE